MCGDEPTEELYSLFTASANAYFVGACTRKSDWSVPLPKFLFETLKSTRWKISSSSSYTFLMLNLCIFHFSSLLLLLVGNSIKHKVIPFLTLLKLQDKTRDLRCNPKQENGLKLPLKYWEGKSTKIYMYA